MIEQGLGFGVVGKAFQKGLASFQTINPRTFTEDVHQTVDDRPFGGGDGMLMMAEPLQKTLDSLSSQAPCYYLSPQGRKWDDSLALEMSKEKEVTLLCGRYGGVDQRFLNKNNIIEISIGDYVLSGGELAALVIIDSSMRKRPSVLGHESSAFEDSFSDDLLESPFFTRPQIWADQGVPSILLSGDHRKIAQFRLEVSKLVTLTKRPDQLIKWIARHKIVWHQEKERLQAFVEKMSVAELELLGFIKEELLEKISEFHYE